MYKIIYRYLYIYYIYTHKSQHLFEVLTMCKTDLIRTHTYTYAQSRTHTSTQNTHTNITQYSFIHN